MPPGGIPPLGNPPSEPDEYTRREKLHNDRLQQDNEHSKSYFSRAYGFAQLWVGFLFGFIPIQMWLNAHKIGLSDAQFVAVVGSLSGTILGFWWLVGRHLFPAPHAGDEKKG